MNTDHGNGPNRLARPASRSTSDVTPPAYGGGNGAAADAPRFSRGLRLPRSPPLTDLATCLDTASRSRRRGVGLTTRNGFGRVRLRFCVEKVTPGRRIVDAVLPRVGTAGRRAAGLP